MASLGAESRFSDQRVKQVLMAGFLVFVLQRLAFQLNRGFGDWAYTEWLIDYSAGFMRRGLSGELIGLGAPLVGAGPAVLTVWSLLFLAGVLGYLRLCQKNLRVIDSVSLAALLFLPSFLPFYVLDHGAVGRKEIIGFPIVLLHLLILERSAARAGSDGSGALDLVSYVRRVPVISVLCSLQILCHEASILLFLPLHVVLTWTALAAGGGTGRRAATLRVVGLYSPVLLSFLAVVTFGQPDLAAVESVCHRWESIGALEPGACPSGAAGAMKQLPGSFLALGWDLSQAMQVPRSLGWQALCQWLLVLGVFGTAGLYVGGSVARAIARAAGSGEQAMDPSQLDHHAGWMVLKYLAFPLVLSLPVYLAGQDFGRWFAATSINFAIVCLSRELHAVEWARERALGFPGLAWSRRLWAVFEPLESRSVLRMLILIAILCTLRLPDCCIDGDEAMSRILRAILR